MRAIRNQWTQHHDEHPEEVQPFPQQLLASMQAGAFHLGADESATGVDPDREGFPAGQGVGAIDDLVPAADLVRRFVAEAEAALTEAARAQTGV
jgi:enoyl-[acyl-carrier protein] reductase II